MIKCFHRLKKFSSIPAAVKSQNLVAACLAARNKIRLAMSRRLIVFFAGTPIVTAGAGATLSINGAHAPSMADERHGRHMFVRWHCRCADGRNWSSALDHKNWRCVDHGGPCRCAQPAQWEALLFGRSLARTDVSVEGTVSASVESTTPQKVH